MRSSRAIRFFSIISCALAGLVLGGATGLQGICGPFTDVAADAFCPFVLEIFTLRITTGTSPTTFDPGSNVNRLQMAAFLSRTVDATLKRGSRRAALNQFWDLQTTTFFDVTTVGGSSSAPRLPASDGADVWVPNFGGGTVVRVRASDGRVLETWTGADKPWAVLWALGSVFVTDQISPGVLYRIDPRQPAGAMTTLASNLGGNPGGLAFDGGRIWTANNGGSVSIVTPGASTPWTVTTVTAGFQVLNGAVFDGAYVWVTDQGADTLLKLDSSGGVLQTVTMGLNPHFPVFDGSNIWVPNNASDSVLVVRASSGAVLATLTGNGMSAPWQAAFDGQRVLVASQGAPGSVSLWKAADLTAIGSTPIGESANGACSDGVSFWITLGNSHLARF